MPFTNMLLEAIGSKGFGQAPFINTYKERQHISVSKLEEHKDITYISPGEFGKYVYTSVKEKRYIGFKELTYDFIFTVYDLNSRSVFAARLYRKDPQLDKKLKDALNIFFNSQRRPNFEARLIGLQNKEDYSYIREITEVLGKRAVGVCEIDMFGDSIRHVAIDISIGTTYNLLLLNRTYRPGELRNNITEDQFGRTLQIQS